MFFWDTFLTVNARFFVPSDDDNLSNFLFCVSVDCKWNWPAYSCEIWSSLAIYPALFCLTARKLDLFFRRKRRILHRIFWKFMLTNRFLICRDFAMMSLFLISVDLSLLELLGNGKLLDLVQVHVSKNLLDHSFICCKISFPEHIFMLYNWRNDIESYITKHNLPVNFVALCEAHKYHTSSCSAFVLFRIGIGSSCSVLPFYSVKGLTWMKSQSF